MSVSESTITNPKKQLEFYRDLSEQLQQENQQLKEQLEMQKDSNKLLCKSIICDDCNCSVCEAHKQQIRLEQQLKQRDEVIEEAIEWVSQKINSCTIEANATTNDTICRITIVGLKRLLYILQKYKGDNNE